MTRKYDVQTNAWKLRRHSRDDDVVLGRVHYRALIGSRMYVSYSDGEKR